MRNRSLLLPSLLVIVVNSVFNHWKEEGDPLTQRGPLASSIRYESIEKERDAAA